ncbi:uncharacterized protein LOC107212998 [Parus major]|uniref:uncharacterized protein LOC107212998 n=1 Tax=Parus major TaxID=9157 RepID=UPI00144401C0|nr:uncharacterized protein LOC107212998 [Parus major]
MPSLKLLPPHQFQTASPPVDSSQLPVSSSVLPAASWTVSLPWTAQLRTQDMTLFKELKGNPEKPFSLTIEEPAPGTVACRLGEPSKPVIRKFFYLNVSEGSVEEEKGLQAVFSTVLQGLHDKTPVPHTPTMGLVLAVGSMAFILLLLAIWQCLCVHQTCHRCGHQDTQEDSGSSDSP